MKKISTIFKRDETKGGEIINEYSEYINPESFKDAVATEKLDGTNVRVTVRNHTAVRLEKRRNPTKFEKAKGIIEPWYIDASESSEDKYMQAALKNTDLSQVPEGEWSGEALGPNIQGNTLGLQKNIIVFFTLGQAPVIENVPITYDELKEWLPAQKSKMGTNGIEGVVWHCPDGKMMKIKTKDFH